MRFAVISKTTVEWQDWVREQRWKSGTDFSSRYVMVTEKAYTVTFVHIDSPNQMAGIEFAGIIKIGRWYEKWHNTEDYQLLVTRVR
jgi:hypothetical protein